MYCPELQIPLNWREALHPYCLIRWVYAVEFTESGAISLLHVYLSSVYLSQSLWGYPFDAGITQHITIITSCRPTFTPILITLKTIHTAIQQTSSLLMSQLRWVRIILMTTCMTTWYAIDAYTFQELLTRRQNAHILGQLNKESSHQCLLFWKSCQIKL
mgnify:CR=1 FL=1